ncbi:NAD dependent epimerase/dehydratase [Drepanopeziza brunnea f. sp. 'multigermtubi' MB_m1]|uniref:NAD dependent epimerase/dehydratase n=1 Tax=Marssonina brunnea f. sp. multigermtubi (strain MB_m1) TaxID=1072389 RepID=K1Y7W8_MARBU|nr:NAD dependent epimerase/dehydratase [Drepanopeziza brunnea f. sp. 'multigermtubi' MB_m1]EKD21194.1 NAD dependent epimerase/dehydratase [Drepanopeziza brunnea f. sp. 'multigermtubi' MB_m1]
MSTKKLVVCGGNGFLGSRICKSAVARGWDVTSISRSGEPTWSSVTSSPNPPAWSHKVTWERADILKPKTYAPLLKDADYVVHSMGILLEADYKGVVSGKESPISGLKRAFSATKGGSQNPLTRKDDEDLLPQETDGQLTYEIMNRDSAIALAQVANKENVPAFVYISAAGGAPVLPARYIQTKRQAESTISSEFPKMRSIFIRPGFLYDSSRSFTVPLAAMTGLGAAFNSLTGGIFGGIMGAAGVKPLKADLVADAVVEALGDDTTKGPVDLKEIEDLAQKAWRKGML